VKLSVKLREEHGLWVFRTRIYRKTFRVNKEEIQEDCRKFRNEEFFFVLTVYRYYSSA